MRRFLCSVSLIASAVILSVPSTAQAAATGDLWEVTTQMTIEGMPAGMGPPSQTRQTCASKEWTKPPVNNEHNCEFTDFQNTATKSSWKMKCDGMSGEGEITRTSAEAYKGWMKMMAPQGTMTMNLSGRRVGDCDAGEAKKQREAYMDQAMAQSAAGQKMAAEAMKQTCSMGAASLDVRIFHAHEELCTGPQGGFTAATYKAAFCEKARTYEGFTIACKRDSADVDNSLGGLAKFCSTSAEAVSSTACPEAQKTGDMDVLAKCCPAQAAAYAAEHCAGLSPSTAAGMSGFCTMFAKDLMDGSKPAEPPPAKKRTGKSGR